MNFAHKLGKLLDPRTLQSAKRHTGRVLLMRRFAWRIDAEHIIASIDRAKFQAIHDRHAVPDPGIEWPKYLDLQKWINVNLRRVRELELDYGRRREILDLGSGAGYFLHICKWLGHRPLGLDIDDVPLYPEMTRMLGLERKVWRIEAYQRLPDLGRKFDLITAFMICFNGHKSENLWGPAEWDFFLDDLARHLRPGGRVWLDFNRENDGRFMTDELRAYFARKGARVETQEVIFDAPPRPLARPLSPPSPPA